MPGIKDILLAILKTQRRTTDLCKTWGSTPVLTVGKPAMELYFLATYAGSVVLPAGQTIYMPRAPFRKLTIINEGNADIAFDVNYKPSDMQQTCTLRANDDIQVDAKGEEKIFSFSAKALAPGGPNPFSLASWSAQSAAPPPWGGDANTAHLRLLAWT